MTECSCAATFLAFCINLTLSPPNFLVPPAMGAAVSDRVWIWDEITNLILTA